jgi:hypothetical protein
VIKVITDNPQKIRAGEKDEKEETELESQTLQRTVRPWDLDSPRPTTTKPSGVDRFGNSRW